MARYSTIGAWSERVPKKRATDLDDQIEAARREFGTDVPILDRMPTGTEIVARESWLERVVGTVGAEEWMWKSRRGLLIAVIVVPPGIAGMVDFWGPPIQVAYEYAKPYVRMFSQTSLSIGERLLAFSSNTDRPAFDGQANVVIAPAMGLPAPVPPGISQIDRHVYRLHNQRLSDTLSGLGAAKLGGRWNPKGTAVLYTSDSVATAMVEVSAAASGVLRQLVLSEIHLRGSAETIPSVSTGFSSGSIKERQAIGADWLRRNETDFLIAPSVIEPTGHSIVVNLARAPSVQIVRSTEIAA